MPEELGQRRADGLPARVRLTGGRIAAHRAPEQAGTPRVDLVERTHHLGESDPGGRSREAKAAR
ncbi:MAG: hypothetical protein MUF00_19145, partial [Gemmatimonadaceae bacterium]|nr:hypothetical protein [Gemmatimonadaceae bacterium]